jgi:Xaa-Pro dipeptidase
MTLHFPRDELDQRVAQARRTLKERGLAALLIFAQESLFYLTGYDSVGYLFFQCAVLCDDGRPITLLTRPPDRQQARDTSTITDIRIWYNAEGVDPAQELKEILREHGLAGERIGIELDTYGLTGANWERVRCALAEWCKLEDTSGLVRDLRVVKSPAELVYVRRAGDLADSAMAAMIKASRPGLLESVITAAGLDVILAGGGDTPPAGPLVNAGRRALYGRSVCGPQLVTELDQVTIEFAATYHRYNACILRTVVVGKSSPRQRAMHAVTQEALLAMTEAVSPGRSIGEIDDAHRRVFDGAGHQVHRYSACGYSLGATYRPSWMDVPPMLYSGNTAPIRPGMVLFLHAMLPDTDAGLATSLGHTVIVTDSGCEVLSKLSLELPIGG